MKTVKRHAAIREKYICEEHAHTEDLYSSDTVLYGSMVNTSFIIICTPRINHFR